MKEVEKGKVNSYESVKDLMLKLKKRLGLKFKMHK